MEQQVRQKIIDTFAELFSEKRKLNRKVKENWHFLLGTLSQGELSIHDFHTTCFILALAKTLTKEEVNLYYYLDKPALCQDILNLKEQIINDSGVEILWR